VGKIGVKTRKRYLVFQVLYDRELGEKDLLKTISNQLIRLFGEVGASKTHFWIQSYNQSSKKGLIECRHNSVQLIRATLTSITEFNNLPLTIYTLSVSGTINAAKRKYLNT